MYNDETEGTTNFGWAHDSPEKKPAAGQQPVELMWNVPSEAIFILCDRMWEGNTLQV